MAKLTSLNEENSRCSFQIEMTEEARGFRIARLVCSGLVDFETKSRKERNDQIESRRRDTFDLLTYVDFLSLDSNRFAQVLHGQHVRIGVAQIGKLQHLDLLFVVFCARLFRLLLDQFERVRANCRRTVHRQQTHIRRRGQCSLATCEFVGKGVRLNR